VFLHRLVRFDDHAVERAEDVDHFLVRLDLRDPTSLRTSSSGRAVDELDHAKPLHEAVGNAQRQQVALDEAPDVLAGILAIFGNATLFLRG